LSKKADGPLQISFEDGYERMKQISASLESTDLSVSEMCQSYAEGKGLGKALLAYLDEREGELKEIDEGKNLPAFEIIATKNHPSSGSAEPASGPDLGPAAGNGVSEDEIPF
jgi:exonuclease VII small subunit